MPFCSSAAASAPAQQHERSRAPGLFRHLRADERAQCGREQCCECTVKQVQVSDQQEIWARGERDRRGVTRRIVAGDLSRRDVRERYRQQRKRQAVDPRAPLVDAEDRVRNRRRPVLERRFLEVDEPVQVRRDPVARDEHFARDLGIAALVGLEPRSQRRECVRRAGQHCPGPAPLHEAAQCGFQAAPCSTAGTSSVAVVGAEIAL
jgi:hypothetical protein